MSDAATTIRRFRVHALHEANHHGRIVDESSFEAAAIAYVEHLQVHADEERAIRVLVHELESGHEHSFLMHVGGGNDPAFA